MSYFSRLIATALAVVVHAPRFVYAQESQRWSSPATWGGPVPGRGQQVEIPAGRRVLLDVTPERLGGLVVRGELVFEDGKELELVAPWIVVIGRGAALRVGTEADPHESRAVITLTGTDETHNALDLALGTKNILVTDGGTLDLHGASRGKTSWTLLNNSAKPGDVTVVVADETGWRPGDRIALAPSGFDPFDAEDRAVTAVSGTTLTLDRPLSAPHYGVRQTVEGVVVDERAEVGLLTRNIVVRGAEDSDASAFGGNVLFAHGGTGRIEGVEMYRMGQQGHKGRYPLHWHHVDRHAGHGSGGKGQYARFNSVHDSYQRAFVIHGTSNVLLERNVAYNVFNHQYIFSEDGDEFHNILVGNLGILAKTPPLSGFAFPDGGEGSEQNEDESSNFWGRNVTQVLIGNRAAGAQMGNGYFFDLESAPVPEAKSVPTTGIMKDNVGHSTTARWFFHPHMYHTIRGFGVGTNKGYEGPGFLYLVNNFFYKNQAGGMWLDNDEYARGNLFADNSAAVHLRSAQFQGNTVIGRTANPRGEDGSWKDGPGVPRSTTFGVTMTDSYQTPMKMVQNRFIGVEALSAVDRLVYGNAAIARSNELRAGATGYGTDDAVTHMLGEFLDADGSLTGLGVPAVITEASLSGASVRAGDRAFFTPLSATRSAKLLIVSPGDGDVTGPDVTFRLAPMNLRVSSAPVVLAVGGREIRLDVARTTSVPVTGLAQGWHVATVRGIDPNVEPFGMAAVDRTYFHVGPVPDPLPPTASAPPRVLPEPPAPAVPTAPPSATAAPAPGGGVLRTVKRVIRAGGVSCGLDRRKWVPVVRLGVRTKSGSLHVTAASYVQELTARAGVATGAAKRKLSSLRDAARKAYRAAAPKCAALTAVKAPLRARKGG